MKKEDDDLYGGGYDDQEPIDSPQPGGVDLGTRRILPTGQATLARLRLFRGQDRGVES